MAGDEKLEVWKNTTTGMRWAKFHDRGGNEQTKLVQGGRTFAITPFDRQVNQDMAATPSQDLFRNGTFTLVKAAEDTNMDEIKSPDSLTDNELAALSQEIQGTPERVDYFTKDIVAPIALGHLVEQLVVDGAPKEAIAFVKAKRDKFDKSVKPQAERVKVADAPAPEPEVKTPRQGIPEAETPPMVQTVPEKVGS
jgi:hypothetical protein